MCFLKYKIHFGFKKYYLQKYRKIFNIWKNGKLQLIGFGNFGKIGIYQRSIDFSPSGYNNPYLPYLNNQPSGLSYICSLGYYQKRLYRKIY